MISCASLPELAHYSTNELFINLRTTSLFALVQTISVADWPVVCDGFGVGAPAATGLTPHRTMHARCASATQLDCHMLIKTN
jgi:hypothetical protein